MILASIETLSLTAIGTGVATFMVLAAAGWTAKKVFLGDPPWATRHEVEKALEEMEKETRVLHKRVDKVDEERRVSVARIHEKIDENITMTSEMRGELKQINQSLLNIQQDVSFHLRNKS